MRGKNWDKIAKLWLPGSKCTLLDPITFVLSNNSSPHFAMFANLSTILNANIVARVVNFYKQLEMFQHYGQCCLSYYCCVVEFIMVSEYIKERTPNILLEEIERELI
jgi:hypothetical protein